MIRVLILGAGGHAKVIADLVADIPDIQLSGFWSLDTKKVDGFEYAPVYPEHLHSLSDLKANNLVTHFIVGVGKLKGGTCVRNRLFRQGQEAGLETYSVISNQCSISSHTIVGSGTVIMPGCVINAGSTIGANCIINTGALIDHDCAIGDGSHIAPGATLSGNVRVGRDSHIGLGASVVQGLTIGDNATIGAGAVVTKNQADGVLAIGVPARVVN